MPIWQVASVEREPKIILKPWLVLQCPDGTRFVIGYHVASAAGRMSSAVVDQDFKRKTVRTASGRLYQLKGPPGLDADGAWVLANRASAVAIRELRDVSGDFWPRYRPQDCQLVDSRLEELKVALERSRKEVQ